MSQTLTQSIVHSHLSPVSTKAILGQLLFAAMALLLPTITHRLGLNYSIAQPMHWMILFAGLTYGPLSGLVIGLSVPLLSFLITGMPMPMVLPLIMTELAVYGFVTGLLKNKLSAFGAVAIALVAGRAVFLVLSLIITGINGSIPAFIQSTWAPGLAAMALQIILLPVLAGLYISATQDK